MGKQLRPRDRTMGSDRTGEKRIHPTEKEKRARKGRGRSPLGFAGIRQGKKSLNPKIDPWTKRAVLVLKEHQGLI